MREIYLLTIEYIDTHIYTQIIDAPNLEAALAYAKEEASDDFSTDRAWSQDEAEGWKLIGGDLSEWRAHLRRADIHRLNNDGDIDYD